MLKKWSLLAIAAAGAWLALDAISPTAADAAGKEPVYIMGPSGGVGGGAFSDARLPANFARVSEVRIRHGAWIDGVQVLHQLTSGKVKSQPLHGGGGGRLARFALRKNEYITAVRGRYGKYVDSIVLRTSSGRVFSTGGKGGNVDYAYAAPPGYQIVGFHGRSGSFLDSIGVVIRRR